nr:hypothetical protein [Tanacetum cinerariifolium]
TREQSGQSVVTREEEDGISVALDPQEALHTREQSGQSVVTREEEDGISVALDPQTNVTTGLSVLFSIGIGSLRCTIAVVVILVKGHIVPTNVKVHPVDEMALVSTTLFFLFKLGLTVLR